MLRQLALALSITLITNSVHAQYPSDTAGTTNTPVARKKISLSSESIFSDNDASARKFGNITVINQLWDTSRIGFLQVGMFNKKAEAVPDKAFSSFLQDYVNNAFKNQFQANTPSLLWIVEDLRIGERTGSMSEKAFTRLKITAYASVDGTKYKLLAFQDNAFQNGGMDVTHKHKNNIARAFKEFYLLNISKLDSLLADNMAAAFTIEEIKAQYAKKRNLPVLTEPVKDGIYFSFNDFRDNNPSVTSFEIEQKKGATVSTVQSDGSKKIIAAYWGVVKNGQIYKKQDRKLVSLAKDGYGFTISTYIEDYRRKNAAVLSTAVVAGLGGAFITESVAKLTKADAFPQLADPEATAIDMETGDLIF